MKTLFTPATLGQIELKNRIVMAPMTRCRATGNIPNEMMAQYYGQRADAGLIIAEGTSPSPNGLGYARIPGLFSPAQIEGWRHVTSAVHAAGGRIFVQLMHTGRVSHPLNMPAGSRILAPSAIAAPGEMWTDDKGMQTQPVPIAMSAEDISEAVAEFAAAAKNAIAAGFDGVELHAANGYLIDQFLNTASNQRTDQWGGSIENRMHFALDVARAVTAAIGPERVGMRLSPYGAFNSMAPDARMGDLYVALAAELDKLGLAYIHIVDHSSMGAPEVSPAIKEKLRAAFKGGCYIAVGGYDLTRANEDLAANGYDLIAFGRPFISNADLVQKLREGKPLAPANPDTFYTPGEAGYLN